MTQLRFLFDEDVSQDIVAYLRSSEPTIDILVVGEPAAPAKGTPDADVYQTAVALGRTLVSGDKKTMQATVIADRAGGGHNSGVTFRRTGSSFASCGGDLRLIWYCETTNDWIDRIDFIPY